MTLQRATAQKVDGRKKRKLLCAPKRTPCRQGTRDQVGKVAIQAPLSETEFAVSASLRSVLGLTLGVTTMGNMRGSALVLAIFHGGFVLLAELINLVAFLINGNGGVSVLMVFSLVVMTFATGAFPAFVFVFSQRRSADMVHERGALFYSMAASVLIAVRQTIVAATSFNIIANSVNTDFVAIASAISETLSALTALAVALACMLQLSRMTRHVVWQMVLVGAVGLCLAVAWGLRSFNQSGQVTGMYYTVLLVCSPVSYLLVRQVFDNNFTTPEAFLCLIASSLLIASFILDISVTALEIAGYYSGSSGDIIQIVMMATIVGLIALFAIGIFSSFRAARHFREAAYSPLLGDRTLNSLAYQTPSGSEK